MHAALASPDTAIPSQPLDATRRARIAERIAKSNLTIRRHTGIDAAAAKAEHFTLQSQLVGSLGADQGRDGNKA